MATANKPAAKTATKPAAKPVAHKTVTESEEVVIAQDIVNEITKISEDVKKTETAVVPKKERVFQPNDTICCRSVTEGTLLMPGRKTDNLYIWAAFGDRTDVEYQDLLAATLSKSNYVFAPLFIVEDEDFVSQRRDLAASYEAMYDTEDLSGIFMLNPADIKATIAKLPVGLQNALKVLASTMIQDGRLDSMQRIKAIDEALGTELFLFL